MEAIFKEYYSNRFNEIFGSLLSSSDGLGDEVVQAELSKMGFSGPIALTDYYSIAGNHKINKKYNILRSLNELRVVWRYSGLYGRKSGRCILGCKTRKLYFT